MAELYITWALSKIQKGANLTPLPLVYLKPASISLDQSNCLLAEFSISSCPSPPVFNTHRCLKDLMQNSDHGTSLVKTIQCLSNVIKTKFKFLSSIQGPLQFCPWFLLQFHFSCSLHMPSDRAKTIICHSSVIIPFKFTCPYSYMLSHYLAIHSLQYLTA